MATRARTATRHTHRSAMRIAAEREAKRRRLFLAGSVATAAVLALILILLNLPKSTGDELPAVAAAAQPYPDVPAEGRVLGDPNAPITVVEYGDYQCPGCAQFARDIEPRLVADYVATGLVRFEFRDYAFLDDRAGGSESDDAAAAAEAAAEQGAFWAFHATLYANQHGENEGAFTEERLTAMAEALGLDMTLFREALDDDATRRTVAAMNEEARGLGLPGTPSFTVNGRVIEYAGYDGLSAAIDAELAALEGA